MGMFDSPGAIAIWIGPLAIRWYGLLIATAVLLGTLLAQREARRRGEDPDQLVNVAMIAIIAGLVGARFYYVLFNWDYYGASPWRIIAIWEGGLAIHGGLIAGVIVGGIVAWRRRNIQIRQGGKLLQSGGLRDPDRPALEALCRSGASPAESRRVRILSSHVPV